MSIFQFNYSFAQCNNLPGWIVSHETCFDNNDGTICCNATVAVFPTSCVLNPNAGSYNANTHCFTGVPPLPVGQFYDVTVTYNNGCTDFIDNLVIIENTTSAIAMNPTNLAACGATSGQVCVFPTGGHGNYSYQWEYNTSFFQVPYVSTANCVSGAPGTYWLRFRDYNPNSDNNCEIIVNYTMAQSQATLTAVVNPTTTCICPGGNGSIILTVTGGLAPLTYSWTGPFGFGANTQNIAALCAGIYNVTVTSADGCQVFATYTVGGVVVDWVGDLFVTNLSDLNWTSTDPWGAQYVIDGNVFVQTGANLLIQGVDVRLTRGHFIRIANGATLTATQDANNVPTTFDAACATTWRGFHVMGVGPNPSLAQQGQRGVLNLFAGTIVQHAECAISNFAMAIGGGNLSYPSTGNCASGGRILCAGVLFNDNVTDISLRNYVAQVGDPVPPYTTELAQFHQCTFMLTTLPAGAEAFIVNGQTPRIYMDHVAEVYFFDCRGIMNPANQYSMGAAQSRFIRSVNSYFDWYGCNEQNTAGCNAAILGYTIGIWQSDVFNTTFTQVFGCNTITASNINPVNHISGTLFECPNAVNCARTNNVRVLNNTFAAINPAHNNAPVQNDNQRIRYAGSAGIDMRLRIAGNTFIEPALAAAGQVPRAVNVTMGGGNLNFVMSNTVTNFRRGFLFQDDNRADAGGGITNIGLHYECNTFNTCESDINIGFTNFSTNQNRRGVASLQAALWSNPNPINPSASAGNDFNQSHSTAPFNDDISIGNWVIPQHTYNYHDFEVNNANQIAVAPFTPDEMSGFPIASAIQTLVDVITLPLGVQNGCGYFFNLMDITGISPLAINGSRQNYLENKALLEEIQDGGATYDLLALISNTSFSNALNTFNQLLAQSPNLSDAVMLAAVENEANFPASMLTIVLASNPSALDYPKIVWALENRANPLDTYQMNLINNGGHNPASPADMIKKEMARYRFDEVTMRDTYTEMLLTDEAEETNAEIASLWHEDEFYEDRIEKANWHYSKGELAQAEDLLLTTDDYFDIGTATMDQLELLVEVQQMERTILDTQAGVITTTQYDWLEQLWLDAPYGAGMSAMNLLVYLTDYRAAWPEINEQETPKRLALGTTAKPLLISVYPNPVSDFAIVKMTTPLLENMNLRLVTVEGIVLETLTIQLGQIETMLPTDKLSSGHYTLQMVDAKGLVIEHISFVKI